MTIFKTLLKKQFAEMMSFLFPVKKNTQKRSSSHLALYIFLIIYVVAVFGGMFFVYAKSLCEPFCNAGLSWLYFSVMGITALAISLIGTVFMTYMIIYKAGDNDILLSMPIPPKFILLVRILGVYLISLFMTAMVMLPSIFVWIFFGNASVLSLVLSFLTVFLIPLLSVTLSCLLALVIAVLMAKTTHKTLISVLFSLFFFVIYFIAGSKISQAITYIATNGEAVGNKVKIFAYPFYCLGVGTTENVLYYPVFMAVCVLAFVLVYFILSKTFLRLSTIRKGEKKKAIGQTSGLKSSGVKAALLKKEAKRFFTSSAYILNAGFGSIFLLIFPILAIVYRNKLNEIINMFSFDITPVIGVAICFLASTVIISASSVSIEGKTLWIIRTLPIPTSDILKAKFLFHMILAGVPTLISVIAVSITFGVGFANAVILTVLCLSYVALSALIGLIINLHFPNLDWKSEMVAVKQGASVILSMITAMVAVLIPFIIFLFVGSLIPNLVFLLIVTAMYMVFSVVLYWYLINCGKQIFEHI